MKQNSKIKKKIIIRDSVHNFNIESIKSNQSLQLFRNKITQKKIYKLYIKILAFFLFNVGF